MSQAARLRYRRIEPSRATALRPGRARAINRLPARPASLRNWWLSATTLGVAALFELILAGRIVVQTLDFHGTLAGLVFDLGGILQTPFVTGSRQPAYTHGAFEPETLRAIAAWAALGLVIPVLGILGALPISFYGLGRSIYRLGVFVAMSLRDLAIAGARAGAWSWQLAKRLAREARPAWARLRIEAAEAWQRARPMCLEVRSQAIEAGRRAAVAGAAAWAQASAYAAAAARRMRPAAEAARSRATAARRHMAPIYADARLKEAGVSSKVRPAIDRTRAYVTTQLQQLRPAALWLRAWRPQAGRELSSLLKELQAFGSSAAQHYRRWADGLAARRH